MTSCRCRKCLAILDKTDTTKRFGPYALFGRSKMEMVVCSICGNKRCPHATDHNLNCSGSNDSGQEGSFFA